MSPKLRFEAAANSPLIWQLGVNAAMKKFGLRNDQVHEARQQFMLNHGARATVNAQQTQKLKRLRSKVINAEVRYPGLSSRLTTESLQAIGSDFNISRQRVHALLGNLRELAKLTGKTVTATVSSIRSEAVRATCIHSS